jgi:hypothetical protein
MRPITFFGIVAAIALAITAVSASAAKKAAAPAPAPSNTDICRADVNGNGVVDLPDDQAVVAAYRTKLGQPKFNARVDFDGNKVIDLADRTFVTTKMGLRCVVAPVNRSPSFTSQPVVTAMLGTPYAYQLAATDPDGDTVSFSLQQGPAGLTLTGALLTWTPGPVGSHAVRVTASDGKGGSATQQFTIAVSAPTPPQVSLTAPATGLVTRVAAQVATGSVSDLTLASGTLRVNDVNVPIALVKGQFSQPVTLSEGVNRLVASASNAGGAGSSAEVVITLDSTAPTIEARMPLTVGAGDRVELLAEAFDRSGVASVTMQADGAPTTLARLPYIFTVAVPKTLARGAQLPLSFTATDTLGNTRTVARTLVVDSAPDTTAPSVLLSAPTTATAGELIPVTVSAEDDRGVTRLAVVQGTTTLREVTESPFAVQHAFAVPANATPGQAIQLTGNAEDAAGNSGTATATVIVVFPNMEDTALHLALNPAASPTFLPSQVIAGTVSTTEVQAQHRPRAFVASLSLTEGRQGQRLQVDVVGANSSFAAGSSQAVFGPGITVNGIDVQSATRLTVDITIAPDAGVGPRLVAVQTGNEEALLLNAFFVRTGVGSISGRLKDTRGNALANVEVCVPGSTLCATTDATGTFSIAGAPSTASRVAITMPGLTQVSVPVALTVGGSATLGDINLDISDIPPPPPPPGGPQPPPAIARVLGLGLADATTPPSLAKGRRLVTEAFIAAGGTEGGVLDETGRQLNPEVAGTGLISLTHDGARVLAHRMERGETVALGDLLFAFSFGFVWTGQPPTLTDWLEVMQARVDAAWASPSDASSVLPILVFNRDRVLTATPPRLAPDLRLGPVQAALLTSSFLGALLPETGGSMVRTTTGEPLLLATTADMDFGGSAVLARRWWEGRDRRPVADSAVGVLRLAAAAAQQGGNTRRLTGFWRNAFAAKNTFVTQTINNVFGAEIKLMMALALPAMAPAGLLTTAANAAIAGAFIGPISNFVQGAYGALNQAAHVPEPPVVKATEVKLGDDGVPLVHVQLKLSRSHVQPSDANSHTWAYSLYRFRTSDSPRELVDYKVISADTKVPVQTLAGTVEREASAISPDEFRNSVVLTLTDRDALPLVEDVNGDVVRAKTATWFYALTATRFQSSADGIREDQLRNAVPWWNYALGGRIDPGGLMALHTKAQHMFVSDYSAPKVLTVDASGVEVRNDGLEIDPKTGVAYYSDTKKGQIFRVDLGLDGSRRLFTVPNFKNNEQIGLAVDSDGSLYSNNGASNAEFGGRIFRFTQPVGARDHVGSINYYSFLLQQANPASASAMTMGPGSAPAVSVEDLFVVDDLAQMVKRVPVRASFDPTRRIGQAWASLPFPARAVDFEFHTPAAGSDDRADGVLLVDGLPAAGLSAELDVESFVALGDSVTASIRIGNPGSQAVKGVRPILSLTGDGELRQVTAPAAPIELAAGATQSYAVVLSGAGSGDVTVRVLGQGADASNVTVSSPPVERAVNVRPPLAVSITVPKEAAPGLPFEVVVEARNRSTTARLIDVTPAIATFDATVGGLDPKGEVALVSGPQPATLAIDAGGVGTFRYQFRGTKMGRAGLEARATATTADTQVSMSAGPAKASLNVMPLTVDLRVPPSLKKDAVFDGATIVLHNLSTSPVNATPVLEMAGLGQIEIVGPNPFGAPVLVPAGGDTTLPFKLKGARHGLAQLEALGRIEVDGTIFNSNRDIERVSVGPTMTGIVYDVGLRALNLGYDSNLLLNGILRAGGLAGLTVVADDGHGTRNETVTGDDGRYVLALEHGGPWVVTVVHPGRNVGARFRDQVVPPGEDVLTRDIDLPVTLLTQARSLAQQLDQLPLKVDHEKVEIVSLDQANLTVSYGATSAAFLSYLQRFQQGVDTPLFEYPLKPAEEKELTEWHSMVRSTVMLAFTKRRFDEAAVTAGPFVKLVVDYVVSKLGISKVGERFDQTLQNGVNNTFFRVPENSSLAKDLADTKIDFDKLGKKAGEIQNVLLKINSVICPYFEGLIDFAEAQGDGIEAPDRADLLAKCKQATDTAAAIFTGVLSRLKLALGSEVAGGVENAVKQLGMTVGVEVLMKRYVDIFTEPVLVSTLHRAERTLEFRGDTVEVVRALRDLDNETRTEVLRLHASIAGHGEVDGNVQGFLKSIANTVDQNLLQHLKDGAGLLGKILTVLTNLDMMTLFGEATVMGPGKVCRASNEVFRADASAPFLQEPPVATLFCVQDLPHDR